LQLTVLLLMLTWPQLIGRPENQKVTKMTMDNLAMVWAPNFLRCLSNDPTIIFTNARKEMSFVRVLLLNWDTSAAESI
jgi:Rho GTPase-activating protein 39